MCIRDRSTGRMELRECLSTYADGLYAESMRGSSRYVVQSKVTGEGEWSLSCTDVKEHFWEISYSADEINRLKKNVGLQKESWMVYFKHFQESFSSDNILLSEEDSENITLTVYIFIEGKQIAFTYKLYSSMDKNKRLVELLMDLVRVAKRAKKTEQEFADYKQQVKKKQQQQQQNQKRDDDDLIAPAWEPQVVAKTVQPQAPQTKKAVAKRKPGYSIVNPNVKRKTAKGAKIEED
eukprot:TRINITY_DN7528_c0_g1_i1.p1 TRINITY_DN7528_c0_g1~~TRINITY_DN7528_c0_g1_i1.p1  ORF type:complete len:236 (+),score=43.82 TRINITY_DN7528_c0_g1_i1:37-744(+)